MNSHSILTRIIIYDEDLIIHPSINYSCDQENVRIPKNRNTNIFYIGVNLNYP